MDKAAAVAHEPALSPPAEFLAEQAPEIDTEEVPCCPVCRSDDFSERTVGFDYEMRTCRNPWRFVSCAHCGHVWLNPRPALHTLPVIYPPTYYAYHYETKIHPLAVWGKKQLDRGKMRGILQHCPELPRTYLDVGCGSGRFLRVMKKRGLPREHIYGLELDSAVVRTLARKGYRVFDERVEDCQSIPENAVDLVTMFHVIEHVDDPAAVLARIASWMRDGGILAIETPNIASLDARWFQERYWGGYHIPRHWSLFTPASLRQLLAGAGLEVVATSFQTGHSFWMYSLHHCLRYGPQGWPRLASWFDPLRGLPLLMLFTAFDKLRARLGFPTSSVLMLARKRA